MQKCALFLTCLAWRSQGRRVQLWKDEQSQRCPCANSQKFCSEVGTASGSKQNAVSKRAMLCSLCLVLDPAVVAFNPSSPGVRFSASASHVVHAGTRNGHSVAVMGFIEDGDDELLNGPDGNASVANWDQVLAGMAQVEQSRKAYEHECSASGPEHPDTLECLCQYARNTARSDVPHEAEPLMQQALEISRKLFGPEDPKRLKMLDEFAGVLNAAGCVNEVEPLQRELLEFRRRDLGKKHEDTLKILAEYAITLGKLGRFIDAEPLMKESLECSTQILGPEHSDTILRCRLYEDVFGPEVEAERAARKRPGLRPLMRKPLNLLSKLRRNRARRHIPLTSIQYEIPEVVSLRLLERLHRICELQCQTVGPKHQNTLVAMKNCAMVLQRLGRHDEAEALLEKALEFKRGCKFLDETHAVSITLKEDYADILNAQGRVKEAKTWNKELFHLKREMLGPEHPSTQEALDKYVVALDELGSRAEAMPMIEEAAKVGYKIPPPSIARQFPEPGTSSSPELESLPALKSLESLKNVFDLQRVTFGLEHPDTIRALRNYAVVLETSGCHKQARPLMKQVLELSSQVLGPRHPGTLRALNRFADALVSQGRGKDALPLLQFLFQLTRLIHGPNHPYTVAAYNKIKTLRLARATRDASAFFLKAFALIWFLVNGPFFRS